MSVIGLEERDVMSQINYLPRFSKMDEMFSYLR